MMSFRRVLTRLPLALAAASIVLLAACSQPTPEEKLDEAIGLFQQGNVARGVLRLQEIVRENPDDPAALDARLALARYYSQDGNAARAIENLRAVYDRARIGDPRHREAHMGLVSLNLQIGDYQESTALYRNYLDKLPEGAPERPTVLIEFAEHLMSVASIGEERDDELFEEGRMILHDMMLEHEEPSLRGRAREVYSNYYRMRGRYEESNAVYERYLEAYPDDTIRIDLELAMAMNIWAMGEKEEGIAMFEAIAEQYLLELEDELERNIRNARLMDLASMYAGIEQYDSAREILEMVMEENVHSELAIRAQFSIAGLYVDPAFRNRDREMLDKSIELLQQMARENPGTSIEDTARRAVEELPIAFEQLLEAEADYLEQQAVAAEAAAQEALEALEEESPEPSLE